MTEWWYDAQTLFLTPLDPLEHFGYDGSCQNANKVRRLNESKLAAYGRVSPWTDFNAKTSQMDPGVF